MSWTFGEIKSLSKIVSDVLDPDSYLLFAIGYLLQIPPAELPHSQTEYH